MASSPSLIEKKEQGDNFQGLPELFGEPEYEFPPLPRLLSDRMGASRDIEPRLIRSIKETQQYPQTQGKGLHLPRSSSVWKNPRTETLPPLRLHRVKELEREEQVLNRTLVEKEAQEDFLQGLSKLI